LAYHTRKKLIGAERRFLRTMTMNARELNGKEVIGTEGWKIGRVTDVILDTGSWQVKALDMELARNVAEEFGMKKLLKSTQIQVKVEDVQGVGDAITLKISKAQLQATLEPKAVQKAELVKEA